MLTGEPSRVLPDERETDGLRASDAGEGGRGAMGASKTPSLAGASSGVGGVTWISGPLSSASSSLSVSGTAA